VKGNVLRRQEKRSVTESLV